MPRTIYGVGLIYIAVAGQAFGQNAWPRRRRHPSPSPPSPSPLPADLQAALQQQLDEVVTHYRSKYPNLVMSVAWTDSSHDVTAASGDVSGREISAQDTFLYGSGTKPFTAAAVLRLVDSGRIKATDKVSAIVDPYLVAHGKPTLADFFGESFGEATVLELIRMGAGIRDFEDDFTFDQWCLAPGNSSKFWDYPYDAMSWSVSPANTKNGGPLYCNPGSCTAYSSTSYEVAGLVLAAVLNPKGAWYEFDLGSGIFDDRTAYPSLSFPPKTNSTTKLSQYLTVPGTSIASTWPTTIIYDQNPSILGWTCGSMVASPKDVAKFFYHLLDDDAAHADPIPLISDTSRGEMTNFQTLTTGWNAGHLKYGAGMMSLTYGGHRGFGAGGINVLGHEGDTYGFLSTEGYVPAFKGAFSVASNVDEEYPMSSMACFLLQIVGQTLGGLTSSLDCRLAESDREVFV